MDLRRAEILLWLVTLVAAAGWVFSKKTLQHFEPYSFMALRFLLAAAVLAIFAWPQLKSLSRQQLLRCVGVGCVMAVALMVWILGLNLIDEVGEGAFLMCLAVVLVPLMGRLFFREPLAWRWAVAIVPALLGLLLLSVENGFTLSLAQAVILLSAVIFALHLNLSNYAVQNIPPLALATIQLLLVGSLALLLAIWQEGFIGHLIAGDWWSLPASVWGWLLSSALIATTLRFALQTQALQYIPPAHASMIFLVEPVWTALLGALLLQERMSAVQLSGCGLIFAAVVIYRLPELWRASR